MRYRAALVVALGGGLLATGCRTIYYGGAPEPSFDVAQDLKQLEAHLSRTITIEGYYANPTREARDKFITGRLVLTNIQYIRFLRGITSEEQLLSSASEMLTLALSLAGTMVDSAGSKTNLAALAAGVTGAKETIKKNYFYEQTIPALVAAMNAERKKALYPILDGMRGSLEQYPFERAVSDLHYYYEAGTFAGAVQAIQADAGAKEREQDQEIRKLRALTEEEFFSWQSIMLTFDVLVVTDATEDVKKIANILREMKPGLRVNDDDPGEVSGALADFVLAEDKAGRLPAFVKRFKEAGFVPVTREMLAAAVQDPQKATGDQLRNALGQLKLLREGEQPDDDEARTRLLAAVKGAVGPQRLRYVGNRIITAGILP